VRLCLGLSGVITGTPHGDSAFAANPSIRAEIRAAVCGKWRWDVKTFNDTIKQDAQSVNLSSKWSSVKKLAALRKPDAPWNTAPEFPPPKPFARFGKIERQAVILKVLLVKARWESNDDDLHLVVSSLDKSTQLVVEFPRDTCTAGSIRQAQMRNARDALLKACPGITQGKWREMHYAKAYVSGLPLFDFSHGNGHPANGMELHPALGFSAASC
jgi:hypothetical protein